MKKISSNGKQRNSNLELLRIVSMLFVVLSHYSVYEPWQNLQTASIPLSVACSIYRLLGEIGVDLFVLITGYFLINRKDNFGNAVKRVAKLWTEVWFYSILTCIIGIIYLKDTSLKEIITSVFPIIFNKYWFVTAYVMLMLLVPFINKVVGSLDKKEYLTLLIFITIFAGVFPIIGNRIFGQETGFSILLAVYLFGGYIRKYGLKIKVPSIYIYVLIIVIYMGMLSSLVILGKLTSFSGHFDRFMYGIFPLIEAVLIFLLVIELKPFTNKSINVIASSVFSTYLVTQNHSMVTII